MIKPSRTCMQPDRSVDWRNQFWAAWEANGDPIPDDLVTLVAVATLADLIDDGIITDSSEFPEMEPHYLVWGDDGDAMPLDPLSCVLVRRIAAAVAMCPSTEVVL